jgi:hypothetical protein
MPRERSVWLLFLACCVLVGVSLSACNDTGSSGQSSKGGFRLSLSKREIPVANRAVQ